MHLKITNIKRAKKTYRYVQLVESYRKPDGRPAHRQIASLGALDDQAIDNLRAALEANRSGKAVVMHEPDEPGQRHAVAENLRYLDLAVGLSLWRELKLDRVVRAALPDNAAEVAAEDVVAAMVLHRCVAPGSKLACQRWFPTTALPELLGVKPGQFNNSRIHRVLAELERGEASLQEQVAPTVSQQEGEFVDFFIDATDTWFEGRGPPMAADGIDKQNVRRRRVGLVLHCDQRGFPLRWRTLDGRFHDPTALLEMATEAATLPWVQDKTVVLDRAAGTANAVAALADAGLRFLTALPSTEFSSSGAPIDWDGVAALQEAASQEDGEGLVAAAKASGFKRVPRDRFVKDLGTFDKPRSKKHIALTRAQAALRVVEYLLDHPDDSQDVLAKAVGLSTRSLRRYLPLRTLDEALRRRIGAGEADGLDFNDLAAIAAGPTPDARLQAFDEAIQRCPRSKPIKARNQWEGAKLQVRGALIFNPERCRETRAKEQANLDKAILAIDKLNQKLASPSNTRSDGSAHAAADKAIKRRALGNVLKCTLVHLAGGGRRIEVAQDDEAWARRRKTDGLYLMVAHPEVPGSAEDLVDVYFARDAIEKDFQVIKSVIELRPIHHQTDAKLRAHVSICCLALLLNRVLKTRLGAAGADVSAAAALELLAPIHLNRIGEGATAYHTITKAKPAQAELLKALGMAQLVDNRKIADRITPR